LCRFLFLRFDRSDPLILILYGDVIISTGSLEQLMIMSLKIVAHEVDMGDIEVLQVVDGRRSCSLRVVSVQAPSKEKVQDVVIR
jgi:hypothetical protein